jgi:serine/threonine protein kinase
VVKVEETEPGHLITRWMAELSKGIARCESLGYVHGNIRPPNLLLDGDEYLKLTDFGNAARMGDEVDVGTAPYIRLLGTEVGKGCGRFGFSGGSY